ncbi:helix-turn-helix domain-containing protein [Asticcacaulis sp.]|uniref:helix-turn-helix domain-containing protein n=1 Tax=Asticcacaulis sp. TaxID=1872648 RepID=UPI003F7CA5B8
MSYRFEDYLSDTDGTGTEVELLDCLKKALAHHGYEKIVFSIFNDPRHLHAFYETFRDIKTAGASLPVDPRPLSIKEREVLTWVAVGKTDYEIAEILGIRQKTVEAHLRNDYEKLNAFNRVTAVVRAVRRGIICL